MKRSGRGGEGRRDWEPWVGAGMEAAGAEPPPGLRHEVTRRWTWEVMVGRNEKGERSEAEGDGAWEGKWRLRGAEVR